VLIRPSGTEPLIRVMVEAEEERLVEVLTARLADVIRAASSAPARAAAE
jgi:phosphoglucosamine mutase